MKKRALIVLTILFTLALNLLSMPTFAWFSEMSSPKISFVNISTISKNVTFSASLNGLNNGITVSTTTKNKGYYPVVPVGRKDFLSTWAVGTFSGINEISDKYYQLNTAYIQTNSVSDRIFQPEITLSGDGANSLSFALYIGDDSNLYQELVAFSQHAYSDGMVPMQVNPFVVQKNKNCKITVLSWLDASKSDDLNVGEDAKINIDIQDYTAGEHYTAGINFASNTTGLNTGYNSFSTGYTVSAGSVSSGEVIIPAYYLINGVAYPVTQIGSFAGKNITKVTIPETVVNVSTRAFNKCASLSEVNLYGGVTLGEYAFSATAITQVVIPDCTVNIGKRCFDNCAELKNVEIVCGQNTLIGDYAFADDKSLEKVVIPNNVTQMGDYSFRNCTNLLTAEVYMVGVMGQHTFHGCSSLISVIIGEKVTAINKYSFNSCSSLKTLEFLDKTSNWKIIVSSNNIETVSVVDSQQNATKILQLSSCDWQKVV